MFRLIPLLLIALLAACAAQPAQPAGRSFPAQISGVEVEIAESLPVQVFARIQGDIGDGCHSLGAITQSRQGNAIDVTVTINHSGAEMCTMQMQMLDQRVQLEGDFPAGEYVVRVNGVEQAFTV